LIFPTRRDERWVGRRGMIGLSLLLLADVLFGFFALTLYRPPLVPYLLAVVATVVLFVIARRLPAHRGAMRSARVPRPLWFALIGFGATLAFFVIHWALPEFALPVPLTILASVALVVIMAWGGVACRAAARGPTSTGWRWRVGR
jgi:cation transport ATPase